MSKHFLSRRVRFFGSVAMLILCVVFFLVPFMGHGAGKALQNMKNDVADWLPGNVTETKELKWFYQHFRGEAFVLLTWPNCKADDPSYKLLLEKLRAEIKPPADEDTSRLSPEEREIRRARKLGDELGLHVDSDYREGWGGRGEKWLYGFGGSYFITPDGKLYRWDGQSGAIAIIGRAIRKWTTGKNRATGEFIEQFGLPSLPGKPNLFHRDPRKLTARLLKSVTTGPEILEKLAGENGTLVIGTDESSIQEARDLAYSRLSGVLFGPEPPPGFHWRLEEFRQVVSEQKIEELKKSNAKWETIFDSFVSQLVEKRFENDIQRLCDLPEKEQSKHWRTLFEQLGAEPPARQTCIMISFSDVGLRDFSLAIGHPIMGKAKGLIHRLATDECEISAEDVKLGGPPVTNVAIDQEGKTTLLRLAFWSAVVGMTLAILCFRSLKVTMMIFFVGGVSAAMSLAFVWWSGQTTDAILMSMPSLVYVLGLSGAIHIVNYYRDAVREGGLDGAPETALRHGWFPCTLAACTTALGLLSLFIGSGVIPIKKFGAFGAIGVMATLILLFTYLPSALHVWNPGYHKRLKKDRNRRGGISNITTRFWTMAGAWVIRRHWWVTSGCVILFLVFAAGLPSVNTTVNLLKLFHPEAKIIRDYGWIEENLSYLVPMELLIAVDKDFQRLPLEELEKLDPADRDISKENLQLSFLERAELANRVQQYVEDAFGPEGENILGRGLSAPKFLPPFPGPNGASGGSPRFAYNSMLESFRDELLKEDYLRIDHEDDRELWRVSLRAGALNDVDYSVFVYELKRIVEPVVTAYRIRNKVLRGINHPEHGVRNSSVLVLGADPRTVDELPIVRMTTVGNETEIFVNQTRIFVEIFDDLLRNKGFRRPSRGRDFATKLLWHDPDKRPLKEVDGWKELWAKILNGVDCVVLLRDHQDYDIEFIKQHAKFVVQAQDHVYDPYSDQSLTATQRKSAGDEHTNVTVAYTGIIPIVYKAQRTLLESLINSIGLAFIMILIVMMVLLRDWRRRVSLRNSLNLPGGIVSMIPNLFPIAIVFGAMGWTAILARNGILFDKPKLVDIGTMMTASVAMGIAVDDTIHFLNWFRYGLRKGLQRNEAIALAYERVATAMTQTTVIAGFGLGVFAFSTFMPTHAFGLMMPILLFMALIGDLIFLPALLAGPLGRFFEVSAIKQAEQALSTEPDNDSTDRDTTPHRKKLHTGSSVHIRVDTQHKGLGP